MRKMRPHAKRKSDPNCEADLNLKPASSRENWMAFNLCDGKLEAPFEEFASPQDEFAMVSLAKVYLEKRWKSLTNQALPCDP